MVVQRERWARQFLGRLVIMQALRSRSGFCCVLLLLPKISSVAMKA